MTKPQIKMTNEKCLQVKYILFWTLEAIELLDITAITFSWWVEKQRVSVTWTCILQNI